jgi:competence protein ComEC
VNWKLKAKLIILIVLIVGALSSLISLYRAQNKRLTVAFLDIGQGDSIFIESPTGNQILIDAGPGRGVLREISKVMPFYDRSIDIVIASHPDADHIGGLPDVFDKYDIDLFMEPGVESENSLDDELEKVTKLEGSKVVEARRGMVIEVGGGARLEILFPVIDPRGMETNAASIVARLVYGENEFLLTGDSPVAIEDYLLGLECRACQRPSLTLEADVLKAGHHGSRTSTSLPFLAAVNPKYAVISSGKDNRYGHPHQEVLDNLERYGVQILRTDQDGRIIFESDGLNLKLE